MPLHVVHRKASQVPPPAAGKINQDRELLKSAIARLTADTVLEVEAGSAQAVRSVKGLLTRAGHQVGVEVSHWHVGTKVFARHKAPAPRARAQAKPATARAPKPAAAAKPARKATRTRKTGK